MIDNPARLAAALADRYRVERELGQGGMATVFVAHDLRHERKVAVKVLRPELAAVIGAERFLTEIRTTANLQHPHILPLFDSGAADSFLFYVMPYVEGISLRDRLNREKQLPIGEAVRIATEIASALDYAHRHGVIHRDIKPENILLHDGSALVADFGIALAASKAGTRMTETGMSLGTPEYMSPEQAMGERELDARSDVYALGCVTYEMLAGEPPFTGPTAQAIVAKVMTAEPADISVLRRTIPPHVADAVHTALQKLPADRFASAQAFAHALSDSAPGRGVRSSRGLGHSRPKRWVSRPVALVAVGVIALLAGALGAGLFLRPDAPLAVTTRMLLQLPAGQEFRFGLLPALTLEPNGSGLLFVGPGVNTRTQLWFRRWNQVGAERLTGTVDEGCCAVFSPSGDTIAYLSSPRQLNLLPLTGGLPATLSDTGPSLISVSDWGSGLDWGADGWLYASGLDGLIRINPRDGAKETLARLDNARGDIAFLWPHLLPGARGALVTVAHRESPADAERASIGIADFTSGRVDILFRGVRAIYVPTGHLIVANANGVLWAVPFDADALRSTGNPLELADTVAVRLGNASPGVADFAIDRAGTLTYVSGGENSFQAVWVDRTGAWRPYAQGLSGILMNTATLSADGRRLVLSMGSEDRTMQLWVQPAEGPPVRLTFQGSVNMRPQWRPGTNRISYLAARDTSGGLGLDIFERDAGGQGGASRLVLGDPRTIGGQTWSPDGRWLIFRTNDQETGGGDILAIRPGVDTAPRTLVATDAEELSPMVSPNGRWLAYSSNESGRREVYVRPFPETDSARYRVSGDGGMSPRWSPTGRELFFIDAAWNMVSVPVVTGASFQSGAARILFSTTGYYQSPYQPQFDLSPDGQRFVMIRAEAGSDLNVVVVTNFLEELKRIAAQ